MRLVRLSILALLLAPLLAAQEDPCPETFPPESCEDSGNAAGVTTAATTPPNCSPCFTIDDVAAAMGVSGPGNQNCQVSTGGATQFLLMATAINGPPPEVVGIYVTMPDGSCTRDDLLGSTSVPAGTLDAADLLECGETIDYWSGDPIAIPNQVCENVS